MVAKDRGSPPLSATATVRVKVLDVNDNSPVFKRNSYNTEVSEDAAEGFQVLQVRQMFKKIIRASNEHSVY